MRIVSDAELRRQIAREGKRWKLVPMTSVFGDVLVAEDIPCVLPLSGGIMYVEHVQRDITAVSMSYPWNALLRNRKRRGERVAHLRYEINEMAYQTGIKKRLEDIHDAMASDIRAADKGRIYFR